MERSNGTMRDELLLGEAFESVLEAGVVIAAWNHKWNTASPSPRARDAHTFGFRRTMQGGRRLRDASLDGRGQTAIAAPRGRDPDGLNCLNG